MIRFIDLGDQILEGTKHFAWFDTVIDTFETFNYSQTWECWKDFEDDYNVEKECMEGYNIKLNSIERYKWLFQWGKK